MRVLVTGASGRLGTHVTRSLRLAGISVTGTSRQPRSADGVEWLEADVTTGRGLEEALQGVDVVVHLASAPYRRSYTDKVELDGTSHVLEAARRTGVGHILYTSIVGADHVPWGYFRTKVQAERLIQASPVPWSILRATQFHEFLDAALSAVSRTRLLVADRNIAVQPVDVRDLSRHICDVIERGPSWRIEEFGGPAVLSMDQAVRRWRDVRRLRRPVIPLRLPGKTGRGFRAGLLTTAAQPTGQISWDRYVAEKYRS